ncbi:PAS domain S-box protein, partial [bacterium]|nr:PAS domain S-box protein [bacterium]
ADNPIGGVSVLQNITEQRRTNRELERHRVLMDHLLTHSKDGVSVVDSNGSLVYWNAAMESITGIRESEALGEPILDVQMRLIPPDMKQRLESEEAYRAHVQQTIDAGLRGEQSRWLDRLQELEIIRTDGEPRIVEQHPFAVETPAGRYLCSIGRDITERRRLEDEARTSSARFRQVMESARDLLCCRNLKTGEYEYVSDSVREVIGIDPAAMKESKNQILTERLHPDDRERILNHIRFLETLPADADHKQFMEFRLCMPDGSVRWFLDRQTVLRDEHGQPEYILCSIRDITEQKDLEEELRHKAELYRVMLEDLGEGVVIADENNRFIFANDTAYRLFDLTPEELIGRTPFELLPPDEVDQVRAQNLLGRKGIRSTYDISIERKNGEKRTILVTNSPRVNEKGEYIGVIGVLRDITELKHTQDHLAKSEANLRAITAAMPDLPFLLDEDGRYLEIHSARHELMYDSPAAMQSKRLSEVLPADVAEAALQVVRKTIATGESQELQYELDVPAGHRVFEGRTSLVQLPSEEKARVVFVARDITGQREIHRALEQSEKEKSAILQSISEMMHLLDEDLTIVWTNTSALSKLGLREADVVGKRCHEVWHGSDHPCDNCPVVRTFQTGKEYTYEQVTPDDSIWEIRSFPVLDENGQVSRVVELGEEITDKKKTERAMLDATRLEATATLAGGLAHDINNLMVGVLGNAQLIEMEVQGDDSLTPLLKEISHSAERAGRVAQEMLAYARGGRYTPRKLNLNESILQYLRNASDAFPPGLQTEMNLTPALRPILADPSQVSMVLMHLVQNAVEAIEEDGILSLSTENLTIRGDDRVKQGKYVLLSVQDNGAGMSDDVRRRIFEPMFSTKFTGRGMGMAAVYGIVTNHEGYIHVESEPGEGTTIQVYWPAVEPDEDSLSEEAGEPVGGRESILIVDDDPMVIRSLKTLLHRLGYEVFSALNGHRAIQILKREPAGVDLVILDMKMPGIDGLATYRELVKVRPDLPVLISSGYDMDEDATTLLIEGARGFLSKPYTLKNLAQTLRSALTGDP